MSHYSVPPSGYSYEYITSPKYSSPPDASFSYYQYETPTNQQSNRKYRSHRRTASSTYARPAGWHSPYIPQGYTYEPPVYTTPTYTPYTRPTYTSPPTYSYQNLGSGARPYIDTIRIDKDDVPTGTGDRSPEDKTKSRKSARLFKTKQGLFGSVNGSNIAAMADTGSRKNVISESYAKRLNLTVKGCPSVFKIGSGREIQSPGTVSLLWAFAEEPEQPFSIICHVLPRCTYDLILGNGFLTATRTLTKFCHRLTRCVFSIVNNIPHFGFLGETSQRLEGILGDTHSVLAVPDTGADRNVMSLQYAVENGFTLKAGRNHCGYLQFADGSYDKTVGQVETSWTFASGERIPVTFEVLEYCCSDVIIGEKVLTEQNVFVEHAASVVMTEIPDDDSYELAPFDFMNSWQRTYTRITSKSVRSASKEPHNDNEYIQEQHRRNLWNCKYDFGTKASAIEQQLELARRERYKSERAERAAMSAQPGPNAGRQPPQRRIPVVPSIPTSQSPW